MKTELRFQSLSVASERAFSSLFQEHNFKYFKILSNRNKDGNNNPVYETAKETLMYRTVLWTLWERERVGRFGRMTL